MDPLLVQQGLCGVLVRCVGSLEAPFHEAGAELADLISHLSGNFNLNLTSNLNLNLCCARAPVFMGMGEPLLNLRAVLAAVRFLNAAVGIGARHITISTVGVPQAIVRLAGHRLQATLAVSIHAPSQALREQLIPRYPPPHACSCAACQ